MRAYADILGWLFANRDRLERIRFGSVKLVIADGVLRDVELVESERSGKDFTIVRSVADLDRMSIICYSST